MATVYFRDNTEPVENERVFFAENGWVAVTGGGGTGPCHVSCR